MGKKFTLVSGASVSLTKLLLNLFFDELFEFRK
jgi:hypothetical protein